MTPRNPQGQPVGPDSPAEKSDVQMDNKQVHGAVVLLGISGAGKSTVLTQMRNQRTKFLTASSTRKPYVALIHSLVLDNMKNLVNKAICLDFRCAAPLAAPPSTRSTFQPSTNPDDLTRTRSLPHRPSKPSSPLLLLRRRWVDFDQRELAEKCAYEGLTKTDLPRVYELWQDHRLREFYT